MATYSTTEMLALAFGFGLMLAGFHGMKRADFSLPVRVVLGVLMVLAGCGLGYWLVFHRAAQHPFLLGTAIALMGLGFNQALSPLRVAMGKSA